MKASVIFGLVVCFTIGALSNWVVPVRTESTALPSWVQQGSCLMIADGNTRNWVTVLAVEGAWVKSEEKGENSVWINLDRVGTIIRAVCKR